MNSNDLEILIKLVVAMLAGGTIGYERTYHGRPAGFRTHALVCTAACLLMFVTVYELNWMKSAPEIIRLDPTRMAQGIMTGIGFLGAGVIIKEGLSVRGLTTAASIWMTSAIGVLAGIGFYFPMFIAVVITVGVLSTFRWLERRMPAQTFYHFDVHLVRDATIDEKELRELVEKAGFSIANFSYLFDRKDYEKRHSMTLRTLNNTGAEQLSSFLEGHASIVKFRIVPTGDK